MPDKIKFAQVDEAGYTFYRGDFVPSDPRCANADILTVGTYFGRPSYTLADGRSLVEEPGDPDRDAVAKKRGSFIASQIAGSNPEKAWKFMVGYALHGFALFDLG